MPAYRNDIQTSDENTDKEEIYDFNPYSYCPYCPLINGAQMPLENREESLMRQRRPRYRPRPIRRRRRRRFNPYFMPYFYYPRPYYPYYDYYDDGCDDDCYD